MGLESASSFLKQPLKINASDLEPTDVHAVLSASNQARKYVRDLALTNSHFFEYRRGFAVAIASCRLSKRG